MIQEPPSHFNFAVDVMERWARERSDAIALWWVDESDGHEQKISFGQLADHFCRATTFFNTAGIQRGDRVLIILPRLPQWWIAMLGLVRLGAVPIPGTPLLTPKDIRYRVETAEEDSLEAKPDWLTKSVGDSSVFLIAPRAAPAPLARSCALLCSTLLAAARPDGGQLPACRRARGGCAGAECATRRKVEHHRSPESWSDRWATHRYGPIFLNVLRVLNVPGAFGLLAPRPLHISTLEPTAFDHTGKLYILGGGSLTMEALP